MAWLSYADWLKNNHLTSSAGNSANWLRQYGPDSSNPKPAAPAPATPAAAPDNGIGATSQGPPPIMPAFNWDGSLDSQGQTAMSALTGQYGGETSTNPYGGTFLAAAHRKFDDSDANLKAAIPGIQRNGALAMRDTQRAAAARGMLRSGNAVQNEDRARTAMNESLAQNQRDQTANANDLKNAQGQASSALATGTAQINTDSQSRQGAAYADNWRRNNGIY